MSGLTGLDTNRVKTYRFLRKTCVMIRILSGREVFSIIIMRKGMEKVFPLKKIHYDGDYQEWRIVVTASLPVSNVSSVKTVMTNHLFRSRQRLSFPEHQLPKVRG